jgi:Saccharopine dehydrogenase NADP binding domain
MNAINVLLIGASGVFGSRIAEQLMCERGVMLTLAGRNKARLEAITNNIGQTAAIMKLDRDEIQAGDLATFDIVIDAAGPFQASHCKVIDAAIAAGCHYADLADGRDFVKQITRFDEDARAAGIAVITGASSIPALSHAVIDDLTADWQQIDAIQIGIFPGNRAPRGKAVVEAILSYVGKPVSVFRGGQWQFIPGWGQTHKVILPNIGKRWASVCDTPEQDLLVARYKPTQSAEFYAGMELGLLHLGLALLSLPVRLGIIRSLRPAAMWLLWMAKTVIAFGSDRGAMDVQVAGVDDQGRPMQARWTLQADANRGPYVPTLAAVIIVRKLRDDGVLPIGAKACSGIVTLGEFQPDFARLSIKIDQTSSFAVPATIA